ncbi:CoA transferase [bacterium]|nr:CoA transferase [bacterium]
MKKKKAKAPFEGLRVLDLSRVLAGPYATMMLAEMGAEIIKIEMPVTGDDSRHFGPFINGKSGYFSSINRGKKSITLNLKKEEGLQVFRELLKTADIVVENYRPGTTKKLGIDFEALKKIKKDIIYAACSGFGHSGPLSTFPAYDMIVQAMGGIMSITGEAGGQPVRVGTSVGDITAALFTVNGISAALYHREKTGEGAFIDVAMLDSQVAILENAIVRYVTSGESPTPLGTRHPSITPFQGFTTKDSYIIIAAGNDRLWEALCRALKREELLDSDDYKTNDLRTENHDKLIPELEKTILSKTTQEWMDILSDAKVPSSPINDVSGVFANPQVKARNMLVSTRDSKGKDLPMAGNPVKMNILEDKSTRVPAPDLGENTEEILKSIGYDDKKIKTLKEHGVI